MEGDFKAPAETLQACTPGEPDLHDLSVCLQWRYSILLFIIIYLRSAPSSATPAMRGAGDPAGPRREAGAGPLGPLGATCGATGEGHGLPGGAVDQAVLGGRSSLTPGPPARPLLAPR